MNILGTRFVWSMIKYMLKCVIRSGASALWRFIGSFSFSIYFHRFSLFFLPQMIFSAVYVFSPIDIIPEGISVVLHFIKMCYLDNTNMKSTVGLNPQRFWE